MNTTELEVDTGGPLGQLGFSGSAPYSESYRSAWDLLDDMGCIRTIDEQTHPHPNDGVTNPIFVSTPPSTRAPDVDFTSGSFATRPQICHVGAQHCCARAELHRLLRPGRWRRDTVMRFSLLELRRKVRRGPLPLIFKGAGGDASVSLPPRLFRPRARSQNTQDYFHACNAALGISPPPAQHRFLPH